MKGKDKNQRACCSLLYHINRMWHGCRIQNVLHSQVFMFKQCQRSSRFSAVSVFWVWPVYRQKSWFLVIGGYFLCLLLNVHHRANPSGHAWPSVTLRGGAPAGVGRAAGPLPQGATRGHRGVTLKLWHRYPPICRGKSALRSHWMPGWLM